MFGAFILAGIGLVAAIFLSKLRPEQLVYQGKSLKAWAEEFAYAPDQQRREAAGAALKAMGSQAVPGLVRLLETRDSFLRVKAFSLAARLPARLRRYMVAHIRIPDATIVRSAAARALGSLGPEAKAAVPQLAQAIKQSERQLRWDAAGALGHLGQEAVPVLLPLVADKDYDLRHAAVFALGQIGPNAERAIPVLIERLTDEVEVVRVAAAQSLQQIGQSALLALIEVVEHGHGDVRGAAAQALTRFPPSRRLVLTPLSNMAQSSDPEEREQALESLRVLFPYQGTTNLHPTQP